MTTVTPLISAMVDRTRTSYRLMRNDRSGSRVDGAMARAFLT